MFSATSQERVDENSNRIRCLNVKGNIYAADPQKLTKSDQKDLENYKEERHKNAAKRARRSGTVESPVRSISPSLKSSWSLPSLYRSSAAREAAQEMRARDASADPVVVEISDSNPR